jgi:hypothetical protein
VQQVSFYACGIAAYASFAATRREVKAVPVHADIATIFYQAGEFLETNVRWHFAVRI